MLVSITDSTALSGGCKAYRKQRQSQQQQQRKQQRHAALRTCILVGPGGDIGT